MISLLLRFWHWLGRLLGQDTTEDGRQTTDHGRPTADGGQQPVPGTPPALPAAPPVTLPPPLPPQFDIHAGEQARYVCKPSVFSKREGEFYRSLLLAVGNDYHVMPKIRLWDFIRLTNEPPERKNHINRLSCRHVDFLLCQLNSFKPVLVIELDDHTHDRLFAQANDKYKNELFEAVDLPILRLDQSNFPPRQLRNKIEEVLENT
jgi:hypothetical protein